MSKSEMRFLRREIINNLLFLLRWENLSYLKEYIRLNETLRYGQELQAYK